MANLNNLNLRYDERKEIYDSTSTPIDKSVSTQNYKGYIAYSSGIVNRPTFFQTLRITFLNTSFYAENFNIYLYDWTSGEPILIRSANLLLYKNEGKIIDILLKDLYMDVELYELKVTPYSTLILINSYNI